MDPKRRAAAYELTTGLRAMTEAPPLPTGGLLKFKGVIGEELRCKGREEDAEMDCVSGCRMGLWLYADMAGDVGPLMLVPTEAEAYERPLDGLLLRSAALLGGLECALPASFDRGIARFTST